jgi:hypothetical protein
MDRKRDRKLSGVREPLSEGRKVSAWAGAAVAVEVIPVRSLIHTFEASSRTHSVTCFSPRACSECCSRPHSGYCVLRLGSSIRRPVPDASVCARYALRHDARGSTPAMGSRDTDRRRPGVVSDIHASPIT